MDVIEALNWRYATKKMNGQSVAQEKVDKIIEAARLAPTSVGLQPFQVIQVTDRALLEKIKAIANGQSQITDASHLLIFAAWDDITKERINENLDRTIVERQLPANAMDAMKERLIGNFTKNDAEENFKYAARQAYIGFGVALVAAAEEKVDATPMEGFNPAALDELLGLRAKGLRSVSLMPLGYRDEANDWLVKMKKVRMPLDRFLITYS